VQVLQLAPPADQLFLAARVALQTCCPAATISNHIFVTGNCSKLRQAKKEKGLLIQDSGHLVFNHFDDSALWCYLLSGFKKFWCASPYACSIGDSSNNNANENERHDVNPATCLEASVWWLAELRPADFLYMPAYYWHQVTDCPANLRPRTHQCLTSASGASQVWTSPTPSWTVNMWIREPTRQTPQRIVALRKHDMTVDSVEVRGIQGPHADLLNGIYSCEDGAMHMGKPLFHKLLPTGKQGAALRCDKNGLWGFCSQHILLRCHEPLTTSSDMNCAFPHLVQHWQFIEPSGNRLWAPGVTCQLVPDMHIHTDTVLATAGNAATGMALDGPSLSKQTALSVTATKLAKTENAPPRTREATTQPAQRGSAHGKAPAASGRSGDGDTRQDTYGDLDGLDCLDDAASSADLVPSDSDFQASTQHVSQTFDACHPESGDACAQELMEGPENPEFDMLRRLSFANCDMRKSRAGHFPARTATLRVPRHKLGQYVVALKDAGTVLRKVNIACACSGCAWYM